MTNRRGFLSAILAGAAAPAVVKASSLMKLVPTKSGILTYKALGRYDLDAIHDELLDGLRSADQYLSSRPTQILLPAAMMLEARRILNAEFDKAYAQHRLNTA
jgi:hypothetical protein